MMTAVQRRRNVQQLAQEALAQVHDPDRQSIPTLLYASINGVIGVIATLPPQQFQFFSKLQVGVWAE